MRHYRLFILILSLTCFFPVQTYSVNFLAGKVVDLYSKQPIKGAIVTRGDEIASTNEEGLFSIKADGGRLGVRAYGYLKADLPVEAPPLITPLLIRLTTFTPKALYLTVYGIGDREIRESAVKLIEETELNALVIDVKGDRGMIPYKSSIPLASAIGAQKIITVRDIDGLMKDLKAKGIYTIARIVVFKDDLLACARPDLAIRSRSGAVWKDRENLSWVDPFKKEVWDYNINVAIDAARIGFDEIQFDYVRFPDTKGLEFSVPNTEENRVNAVTGFLMEAKKRLSSYNVFVAADIFGYVCWNLNDTFIGQKLETLPGVLDYISPMLYPSGFQYGIPEYRNPVAHPYEVVYRSLQRAAARTALPRVRFRPWLQAFRDYAFGGRPFTGREIRTQIDAAENFGSNGWMLWNPHNVYSDDGLKREITRKGAM